nr:endoplasmic reticulum oxidoreductin-2-like [Physcomitrium patens]|eukprot:XP_024374013.1 endoplasmic reticulum oxidoreductin-2-like [Physcomitrella patens]
MDNPWTINDETKNGVLTYVNLLLNPEKYTRYKGESACRIWETIYFQNCSENGEKNLCTERRVLQNLYSTYLFVLRDLLKAEKYLSEAKYSTSNDAKDHHTHKLMVALVGSERLPIACPISFDEAKMWRGPDADDLKQQLQKNFRNIIALTDCVDCEKAGSGASSKSQV